MSNNDSLESQRESFDSKPNIDSQASLIRQVVSGWISNAQEPMRQTRTVDEDVIIPRGRAVLPSNYKPVGRANPGRTADPITGRTSEDPARPKIGEANPVGRAFNPLGRANPGRLSGADPVRPSDERIKPTDGKGNPVGRAFNPMGRANPGRLSGADPVRPSDERIKPTDGKGTPVGRAFNPMGRANPGRFSEADPVRPSDERVRPKDSNANPVGRAFNPMGRANPGRDARPVRPVDQAESKETPKRATEAVTQESPGLDALANSVRTAVKEALTGGASFHDALTKVGESIESALPGYSVVFENTPAGQLLMRLYGTRLPRTGLSVEIQSKR